MLQVSDLNRQLMGSTDALVALLERQAAGDIDDEAADRAEIDRLQEEMAVTNGKLTEALAALQQEENKVELIRTGKIWQAKAAEEKTPEYDPAVDPSFRTGKVWKRPSVVSSAVRIADPTRNVNRTGKVWKPKFIKQKEVEREEKKERKHWNPEDIDARADGLTEKQKLENLRAQLGEGSNRMADALRKFTNPRNDHDGSKREQMADLLGNLDGNAARIRMMLHQNGQENRSYNAFRQNHELEELRKGKTNNDGVKKLKLKFQRRQTLTRKMVTHDELSASDFGNKSKSLAGPSVGDSAPVNFNGLPTDELNGDEDARQSVEDDQKDDGQEEQEPQEEEQQQQENMGGDLDLIRVLSGETPAQASGAMTASPFGDEDDENMVAPSGLDDNSL